MSNPIEKADQRRAADLEEQRKLRLLERQIGVDARVVLHTKEGRNLVGLFLEAMQVGSTPFSTNAMLMARACGQQEAGQWWLNLIRRHCPDMERKIAKERREAEKFLARDKSPDEDQADEH